jgi:protoheme IX farnesyltransferase
MRIFRPELSLAVAFSSVIGCVMRQHAFTWTSLSVFFGVSFLAFSASALNQIMEQKQDLLMERTRTRPIPSGKIRRTTALITAGVFGATGAAILLLLTSPLSLSLGISNLALYLMVYTPMKKRSPFALLTGAVNGAIPPLIGWFSIPGGGFDTGIAALAVFMYLWQIPHFLILQTRFASQYTKAGFPTLIDRLGPRKVRTITLIWLGCCVLSTALFPLSGIVTGLLLCSSLSLLGGAVFVIIIVHPSPDSGTAKSGQVSGSALSRFGILPLYLYQVAILLIVLYGSLV